MDQSNQPSTVFFIDHSGSVDEEMLRREYKTVRERMRQTQAICGAVAVGVGSPGYAVLAPMLSGPQSVEHLIEYEAEVQTRSLGIPEAIDFYNSVFGELHGPLKKVLVTDGYLASEDLALFDEVVVMEYKKP